MKKSGENLVAADKHAAPIIKRRKQQTRKLDLRLSRVNFHDKRALDLFCLLFFLDLFRPFCFEGEGRCYKILILRFQDSSERLEKRHLEKKNVKINCLVVLLGLD